MILIEGKHSFHLAARASLVTEDREIAWAEKHVIRNPAYAWILGRYVGTNEANDNGHIFELDDLREAGQTLQYAPLNMLHRPHHVMGAFVASELVYPISAEGAADGGGAAPYLEALAAFWRYYFRDDYAIVSKAHAEGVLSFSMECIPETVSCAGASGCGETFEYNGRTSPTYCAHLNEPRAPKKMGRPHFTAGALVVPPAKPAWRNANVTELSALVAQELQVAEAIGDQVEAEFPHLSPIQFEGLMSQLARMAAASDDRLKKVPHDYDDEDGHCRKCGMKKSAPMHKAKREESTAAYVDGLLARARRFGEKRGEAVAYGRELAREFTSEQRRKSAQKDHALDDGSYPIENVQDLKNAIRAFGRAPEAKRAKVKAHIKRRASALGAQNLIPEDWR